MLEVPDGPPNAGIEALNRKLALILEQQLEFKPGMVLEVIHAVLAAVGDELTAKEATLLREVEELGRTIAIAKSEIAALRVDDITDHDIPFATDELDAIVEHTARATHAILESCEMLDAVSEVVTGEPATKLQDAVTRIYEACSFQDITGQRITKVVTTLKVIEEKVAHIIATFGSSTGAQGQPATTGASDADLLNGPQLPAHAMGQSDIDKLLASFE